MRKRHKIGDPPSWQHRLVLVFGWLFGITILLFAAWAVTLLVDWARVDDCLNKGGRYDYEIGECDFEENHSSPED